MSDSTTALNAEPAGKTKKYSYLQLFRYSDNNCLLWMSIGLVSGMINGSVTPIMNLIVGDIANIVNEFDFDNIELNRDSIYARFTIRLVYLGVLGIASLLFGYLQSYLWSLSAEKQALVIRRKYFEAVLRQDMTWFSENPPTELAPRISGDVNLMQDGMAEKIGFIVQYTTSCIIGLALACYTSWRLTLILIGVFPLPAAALHRMWHKVGVNIETVQNTYSKAGAIASEAFKYISTLIVNNGQEETENRFQLLLEHVKRVGMRVSKINAIGIGLVTFFFISVRTPVFYFGGFLVLKNELSTGDAIATFLQISSGVMYLMNVVGYLQALTEAHDACQRVFQVIELESELDPCSTFGSKPEISGNIEFKNVTFAYPSRPDSIILNDFSLKIPQGKTVALVGPSGSGKSTVFQLLMRMYDPTKGSVSLDEHDLKSVNLGHLRQQMSIVGQEPVLFDKTIHENVALGAVDKVEDSLVVNALETANAWEFVEKLPKKQHTPVFRGTSIALSGGQKQRVAIARAIIRNPKILLLDEATSALDTSSEKIVQQSIDKLARNQTTLIIAHRLSTIKNVDVIVVINKGRVVEQGCHNDLIKKGGLYSSMIKSQETTDVKVDESLKISKHLSIKKQQKPEFQGHITQERVSTIKKYKQRSFPLKRIYQESKKDMKFIIIGLFGSIFDGSTIPLEAFLMGLNLAVYSNPEKYGGENAIILYSLLFLPLGILNFVAKAMQQYGFGIAGFNLTERLRAMAFSKLIRQDMYFFDQEMHSAGALSTALTTDADAVKRIGASFVGQMITMILNSILGLAIAFAYGWQLTLVMLACSPLIFLGTFIERRILDGLTAQTRTAYEKTGQLAYGVLSNMKTVAMLAKETVFIQEFNGSLKEPHELGIRKAKIQALGSGSFQTLQISVFMIAFSFCYYLITRRLMEFSNIFVVILLVIMSSVAAGALASNAKNIAEAKAGALAIFDLCDSEIRIDPESKEGFSERISGKVEFKNVWFKFPSRPDQFVLKGIDLTIKPGETVALVGGSGCGKSTIAALLQRLYDPDSGSIQYAGVDLTEWNLKKYRSLVGVVGQEPALFNLTVEENIRFGLTFEDEQEMHQRVIEAAKLADIHNFIISLQDGYQTRVGEMGSLMSGGQKQRLAIARALLRRPLLLILDEATSALDSETEEVVENSLILATRGISTLIIAHRLNTVQRADKICVLAEGRIVEQGTHEELVEKNGIFYEMLNQQTLD